MLIPNGLPPSRVDNPGDELDAGMLEPVKAMTIPAGSQPLSSCPGWAHFLAGTGEAPYLWMYVTPGGSWI